MGPGGREKPVRPLRSPKSLSVCGATQVTCRQISAGDPDLFPFGPGCASARLGGVGGEDYLRHVDTRAALSCLPHKCSRCATRLCCSQLSLTPAVKSPVPVAVVRVLHCC